ncbi:MAG: hypothetical protein IK093_12260 [Ruminiclostridium sp.]|nr:hypothetical protein [Ruminiclostridium sp.]
MTTREQAKVLYEYYDRLIGKLTDAKFALLEGGAKSYKIDDRELTRFDIDKLGMEIDDAIKKRSEMEALMNGRAPRKAVAIVPRDW